MDAVETEANPKTDKRVVVRWTSHSIAHIAEAVAKRGFTVGLETVRRILKDKGYARDRRIRKIWKVGQTTLTGTSNSVTLI